MRYFLPSLLLLGCGSVKDTPQDGPTNDGTDHPDTMTLVDAATCGGAGQACCASNTCNADLTCTTSDQTCRASQLFIGASNNQTGMAYVVRSSGAAFNVDLIGMGSVGSIWGTAANDVWAIAIYNEAGTNAQKSYARHWNGSSWEAAIPFTPDGFVYALWGSAPNNYWAFTNGGSAYHWTGATWGTLQSVDSGQVFSASWGAGPTNIWAFASNRMSHYDGTWTSTTRADFSASRLTGIRASGVLWAGGSDPGGYNPAVLHAEGSTITVESLSADNNCHSVVVIWPGQDEVWAVSNGLFAIGDCTVGPRLFHRTTGWTEVTGVGNGWQSIAGMWGTSNKDIYMSGKDANATPTVFHYNGTAWTAAFSPTTVNLLGPIWGPGGPN